MSQVNQCEWYDPRCTLEWIVEEIKQLFFWIYDIFLMGVVSILELIPAPDFIQDISTVSIDSGILYFLSLFAPEYMISVFVTAYTLRFLIRRIPFIG